jgi:hypothetical protein
MMRPAMHHRSLRKVFRLAMFLLCIGNFPAVFGQTYSSRMRVDTFIKPQITTSKTIALKGKKPKPVTNEFSGGIRLTTDGWGLFLERGYMKTEEEKTIEKFHNLRIFTVDFSEHKHPKERKQTYTNSIATDKPKAVIFGKVNNFYSLKLGYGYRRMIAGKPEPGTVSIHWVYSGGLSVGLLKPYYIDAYVSQDNPKVFVKKNIKYSDETREFFLDPKYIVGSAGWTKGIDETKILPGIHARTGLHFDFGKQLKTKWAIETGVSAELYTQKIELMADQKAYPYTFSGYLTVQFGKRW